MRSVLEILKEIQPETVFEECESIVDEGILDSFDIVTLIGELNEEYHINIPVWEIIPENFNSVKAMEKLVEKQRKK